MGLMGRQGEQVYRLILRAVTLAVPPDAAGGPRTDFPTLDLMAPDACYPLKEAIPGTFRRLLGLPPDAP